jgi:uncharacterized protein (TIGR02271 family)
LYSEENINVEYVPKTSTPKQIIYEDSNNVTFQLKKEQLDIAKKWIETEEVKIYRETSTEEKNFIVPVKREELVIEKKSLASATPKQKNSSTEIIRIPLSEEKVEFIKHRVALEDVSIYKQQVEEIKHIEETLKSEVAKIQYT